MDGRAIRADRRARSFELRGRVERRAQPGAPGQSNAPHNRESPGRAQDGKLREHEYQPCTKPRYSPVLKPAAGAPVRSTLKKRVT